MAAVLLVLAYAIGTVPTAIVIGARRGVDPTAAGSGNPGATNMYRTAGRRAGVFVLVVDLLKGAIPAGVGLALDGATLGLAMGLAAVVGHIFPVQRRFKGGKGVATAAGVGLATQPLLTLGLAVVFGAVAKLSRHVAIGSISIGVLWPVGMAVIGRPIEEVALTAVMGALIVFRHASNIDQLLAGGEASLEP